MLDISKKSEQTNEKGSKPKTTKAGLLPRKQNKKLSQNKKKWIASGFGKIKKEYLYTYTNNYTFIRI